MSSTLFSTDRRQASSWSFAFPLSGPSRDLKEDPVVHRLAHTQGHLVVSSETRVWVNFTAAATDEIVHSGMDHF